MSIYIIDDIWFCTDDICTWYDEDSSHQFPLVTKRFFRGSHRVFLAIFKSGTMIWIVRKRSNVFFLKNRNYTGNRAIETGIIRGQQKMNSNVWMHTGVCNHIWARPSDEPRISLGGFFGVFGCSRQHVQRFSIPEVVQGYQAIYLSRRWRLRHWRPLKIAVHDFWPPHLAFRSWFIQVYGSKCATLFVVFRI